jgi:hypothetical protein
MKRLFISISIICFSFFIGSSVLADDILVEQTDTTGGWLSGSAVQSFRGVGTFVSSLEFYAQDIFEGTETELTIYFCEDDDLIYEDTDVYVNHHAGCFGDTIEVNKWILPNGFNISSSSPEWYSLPFSSGFWFATNTQYYLNVKTMEDAWPYDEIANIALGSLGSSELYPLGHSSWAHTDIAFKIYGDDVIPDVTIIELPEIEDVNITVEADSFTFPDSIVCAWNATCTIPIYYTQDDIGSMVLLLESTATSVEDYIDIITELEDKQYLKDELTPIPRTTETMDKYMFFVSPSTGSSSLYQYTKVYWQEEAPNEDLEASSFIIRYLKNLFPISIFLQLKDIIDFNKDQINLYDKIDVNLDTLIHDDWEQANSSTTILSADLINDNLPLWQDKIYPFLGDGIWILTFILILIRVRSSLFGMTREEI